MKKIIACGLSVIMIGVYAAAGFSGMNRINKTDCTFPDIKIKLVDSFPGVE